MSVQWNMPSSDTEDSSAEELLFPAGRSDSAVSGFSSSRASRSVTRFLTEAVTSAGRIIEKSFRFKRGTSDSDKLRKSSIEEQGEIKSWTSLKWEYSQHDNANTEIAEEEDSWLPDISIPVFHDRKIFVGIWDMIMLAFISYTAIAVPYQAGFGRFKPWDNWFIFNLVLDIMFTLDMLLQFNISYYSMRRQVTVLSRKNIISRYLSTAFPVDLISVLPLEAIARTIEGSSYHSGSLSVRICSLVKILRLTRLGRIVRRVEASNPINYGVWTMLTFVLMTVVLSHWIACLWGMVAIVEIYSNPEEGNNWMFDVGNEYGLVWNETGRHFQKAPLGDGSDSLVDTSVDFYLYTSALYFAVYSLASVGYGDLTPVSDLERYVCCGIMLLGAYFLGYIVASITSVVATRNADSAEYYRLMDQLNKFMDEHQLDKDLRGHLRAYFHYRKQTHGMHSWATIIAQMSPNLRKEVFAHTSCQLIQDVEFFCNCDSDGAFIMDLGMCLDSNTYTPKEKIINIDDEADNMYIVRRGVCASEGNIFMRQGVFGMDMLEGLIREAVPVRNYMSIALTYSDVLLISIDSLKRVLLLHPDAAQVIRKRVLRRIMQQEVRAYTSAMSRILTGRRPYWTRLRGDPGGREQFYYDKLLAIVPAEANFERHMEKVAAAGTIQRAVRNFLKLRKLQRTWGHNLAPGLPVPGRPNLSESRSKSSRGLKLGMSHDDMAQIALDSKGDTDQSGLNQWQGVLSEVEALMDTLGNATKERAKMLQRRKTVQI